MDLNSSLSEAQRKAARDLASTSEPVIVGPPTVPADREAELESMVRLLLRHNKNAVHPGRGKQDAALVRRACRLIRADEDDFLPGFVVRDKARWGLDESDE